ncbi:hypothetical protein D3C87_2148840 [compost metagenome]
MGGLCLKPRIVPRSGSAAYPANEVSIAPKPETPGATALGVVGRSRCRLCPPGGYSHELRVLGVPVFLSI